MNQADNEMEFLLNEIPHANTFYAPINNDPLLHHRSPSSVSDHFLIHGFQNLRLTDTPTITFGDFPADHSRFQSNYTDLRTNLTRDASRYYSFDANLSQMRLAATRNEYPPLYGSVGLVEPMKLRGVDENHEMVARNRGLSSGLYGNYVNRDSGIDPRMHYDSGLERVPERTRQDMEAFICGDSLIIPSRGFRLVGVDNNEKEMKRDDVYHGDRLERSPVSTLDFDGVDPKMYIYCIAKDQNGCRFLQRKFDEGKHMADNIFARVIGHIEELMVNPFGNYLIQKLLDVCSEEQRMWIIRVLTDQPMVLIKICMNTHGTRVVQKLIETLKTRRQVALVISAIEPGFLNLINDMNGNHVVQRCLQTLSNEDNKFIFEAAARHCVSIATHRHGCCVMQHCISHATGIQRANLATAISSNALLLAQDAFGNYVVQFLLDLKIPSATEKLALHFRGNYVHLSMQKFSSNVVQRCIKVFGDNDRRPIIIELLQVPHFEHLMQDPYANYVVQSALLHSKGQYHAALVEAIRPHAEVLRSNPHCKKILSLMKK